jgi:hypothetical protein
MTTTRAELETRPTGVSTSDVDLIKAGIEQTQAELANTVAELQRKLSPSHVYARARTNARRAARRWAETGLMAAATAVSQIERVAGRTRASLRRNPSAAALIAAGTAAAFWHAARRARRARDRRFDA